MLKNHFSVFLLTLLAACSDGGTGAEQPFAAPEQVSAVIVGIEDARTRIIPGLERPDRAALSSEFEDLTKELRRNDRAGVQRRVNALAQLLGPYGNGGSDAPDLDLLRLTAAGAASLVGARPAASLLPPGEV
ncbi:MAG TPA: hypothetical protein VK399_11900 [Longimicrobiaceae bacterium]|jgi:hypothetical protein|nr:hypothetical protein [Longimicrobiaceae bacterium]